MAILQFILFLHLLPGLPVGAPGVPHDLKMSVCEIAYVQDSGTFNVKFYLFEDDLKVTLYPLMHSGPIAGEDAETYILKHFSMQVNGHPLPLTYTSLREKKDQVLVQFKSPELPGSSLESMQVHNDLPIEQFKRQINMVYLYFPDEDSRKTEMLDATKTLTVFSF